jgi:hypothetical protein
MLGRYIMFRLKDMISVKVSSRVSSKEVEYFSYGRW